MKAPKGWLRSLALALGIYVAVTVVWLAPLFAHFGSAVLQGPTDAVLALSDYWAADQVGETPFTFDHDPYVGAPEGTPRSTTLTVANALQPLAFLGLEPIAGNVGAWNVLTVSGFFLSALAAFALLLYLRFRLPTALLGGYAFGFSPWMFARALEGHAGMQHLWVLPLLFLSFLLLHKSRHAAHAVLLGGLLATAFYLHAYIGLMGAVMVCTFYVLELSAYPGRLRTLLSGIVSLVTALILFAPPLVLYLRDRSGLAESVAQPFTDLQAGGATLLDYLLPSQGHPFLGWMRPDRLAREHVLFFGWSTTIAAGFGAVLALRGRRWRHAEDERSYAAVLAILIGVVALAVSFKPVLDIGGVELKTPSYLIGQQITAWRAYARLGVDVGLSLIVLAAFSFEWLLSRRHGAILGAAAAVVLVVELATGPPVPTWRTDTDPPHVAWLRDRPGGIVANYPLPIEKPTLELGAEETWNIVHHGHPLFAILNGSMGTREEAIRIVASNIADPLAAGVLAAQKVRYVVVHDDVYRAIGADVPQLDPSLYRLLARPGGDTRIYGVKAQPVDLDRVLLEQSARIALARAIPPPDARYSDGFNPPEMFEDGREWRWMIQGGRIAVSSAEPGRYFLVLDAFANGQPRTLTLRTSEGETLASGTVQTSRQTLTLGPFELSAPTTLVLSADPGPQQLDANRRASVFLSPFELRPTPDFKGRLND